MNLSDSHQRPTAWQASLPHLICLGIATGIITLSFSMRIGSEPSDSVYQPWSNQPLPQSCSSRMMFGISCPGCGLTRSFIAISHGKFQRAWNFNAASFLVYSFVFAQIPWQLFQIFRIRMDLPKIHNLWIYLPLIAIAVALVMQWVIICLRVLCCSEK